MVGEPSQRIPVRGGSAVDSKRAWSDDWFRPWLYPHRNISLDIHSRNRGQSEVRFADQNLRGQDGRSRVVNLWH